jgi:hypothetical protein
MFMYVVSEYPVYTCFVDTVFNQIPGLKKKIIKCGTILEYEVIKTF